MEKIILGLLMMRGMTVYYMKSFINNNLDAMCSASPGSIHTAIKKMIDKGLIKVANEGNRKVYFITKSGREEFDSWIESPMQQGKGKNIELSKLFFLGLSDPEDRKKSVENYIASLIKEKNKLEMLYDIISESAYDIEQDAQAVLLEDQYNEEGIKKNIYSGKVEDTISDIYKYQRATLLYSVEYLKFEINWYTKFIKEM